ncbi:hypothetical protein ABIC37_006044 [Priestia megaterium]
MKAVGLVDPAALFAALPLLFSRCVEVLGGRRSTVLEVVWNSILWGTIVRTKTNE